MNWKQPTRNDLHEYLVNQGYTVRTDKTQSGGILAYDCAVYDDANTLLGMIDFTEDESGLYVIHVFNTYSLCVLDARFEKGDWAWSRPWDAKAGLKTLKDVIVDFVIRKREFHVLEYLRRKLREERISTDELLLLQSLLLQSLSEFIEACASQECASQECVQLIKESGYGASE